MFSLLKKIASRGLVEPQESAHAEGSLPEQESNCYPPRRVQAGTSSGFTHSQTSASTADTLWTKAVAELRQARAVDAQAQAPSGTPPVPVRYGQVLMGGVHSAVAAAVFERRNDISRRVADISHRNVLIARFLPERKTVWIRNGVDFSEDTFLDVTLRPDSAGQPAGGSFDSFDLVALLWHFGLSNPAALAVWPEKVAECALQLRRFPPIAPYMLDPRHLALFYVLGRGALTFDELCEEVGAHRAPQLCADLTALLVTRSLGFVSKGLRSVPPASFPQGAMAI